MAYESINLTNVVVDGDETVNGKLVRDWAAIEGGAKLKEFSPPDYSDYGCGPGGAFDLSLGSRLGLGCRRQRHRQQLHRTAEGHGQAGQGRRHHELRRGVDRHLRRRTRGRRQEVPDRDQGQERRVGEPRDRRGGRQRQVRGLHGERPARRTCGTCGSPCCRTTATRCSWTCWSCRLAASSPTRTRSREGSGVRPAPSCLRFLAAFGLRRERAFRGAPQAVIASRSIRSWGGPFHGCFASQACVATGCDRDAGRGGRRSRSCSRRRRHRRGRSRRRGATRTVLELFDSRAAAAAVSPSRATARARVALARHLGSQGVVIADPLTGTLRMVGRLDGFLTGASARPADASRWTTCARTSRRSGSPGPDLRTFQLRRDYVDIPGTHHLSWTQRVPRRHGLPERSEGQRDQRRPADQPDRLARAWAAGRARRSRGSASPTRSARRAAAPERRDRGTAAGRPRDRWCSSRRAGRAARVADDDVDRGCRDPTYRSSTPGRASVLWRANMTHADAAGTGQRVGLLPGQRRAEQRRCPAPGHVPGVRRNRAVRQQRPRLQRTWTTTTAQPKDEVKATSGLDWGLPARVFDTTNASQNCSTTSTARGTRRSRASWQQQRRTSSACSSTTSSTCSTTTCWRPRSGSPRRPGNFQVDEHERPGSGRRRGPGPVHRRREPRRRAPRRRPRQQREHVHVADGEPPRHADVPATQGAVGPAHPSRRLRQRGRHRLPRVHARPVEPAGHLPRTGSRR